MNACSSEKYISNTPVKNKGTCLSPKKTCITTPSEEPPISISTVVKTLTATEIQPVFKTKTATICNTKTETAVIHDVKTKTETICNTKTATVEVVKTMTVNKSTNPCTIENTTKCDSFSKKTNDKIEDDSNDDTKYVTVNKTIVVETTNDEEQGIECKPDCPCELEGNCANPCESLKCEIIKAKTSE